MMTIYNVFMSMASFVICMAILTGFELFNVWNISDKTSEDYAQSILSVKFYTRVLVLSSIIFAVLLAVAVYNYHFYPRL